MKKFGIIMSIIAVLAVAGCASSGGGSAPAAGGGDEGGPGLTVDLSTVSVAILDKKANTIIGTPTPGVRNAEPFVQNYDDLFIILPELSEDVTKYSRITIKAKYFNAAGEEVPQGDGNAMLSVIEDVNDSANIRGGGAEGVYKNIPLKTYNVGGFSSAISSDKGMRIRYSRAPGGILFQCSNTSIKFIEVTEITFHN